MRPSRLFSVTDLLRHPDRVLGIVRHAAQTIGLTRHGKLVAVISPPADESVVPDPAAVLASGKDLKND